MFGLKKIRKYFPVFVVLTVGFILSALLFFATLRFETERMRSEFDRLSEERYDVFKESLQIEIEILYSLRNFYVSSQNVTRAEFTSFTSGILKNHPEIITLEWVPRISGKDRDSYTIEYLEPFEPYKKILGFDYASEPLRHEAMEKAMDNDSPVVTDPVTLFRISDRAKGMVVFLPVYRNDLPHETPEERRENLSGFVTEVLQIGEILKSALAPLRAAGVDIDIYDGHKLERARHLYHHSSRTSSNHSPRIPLGFTWQKDLNFAGKTWTFVCKPSWEFFSVSSKWQPWGAMGIGLLFTFVLGIYFYKVASHSIRLQSLLEQVTKSNEMLVKEIGVRESCQAALSESELRNQLVARATSDAIWDWDIRSGQIYFNEGLRTLFGYEDEDLKQPLSWWEERVHQEDHDQLMKDLQRFLDGTEKKWRGEYRFRCRDGSYAHVIDSCYVIRDEKGKALRAVGAMMNVTEQRNLEAQFRQAQKMEVVGQLTGSIAHDFNNLLTLINGYSEMLMKNIPYDQSLRADLEEIYNAGLKAATLTRQLLSFSRRQIMEFRPVNLNEIVLNLIKMLKRLVGEHVELSTSLSQDLGTVMADPAQIEQVLANLVVNARDAMPNGGKLTLASQNIELSPKYARRFHDVSPGPYVLMTVTDTGSGMTPEVQSKIFEPFFSTKGPGKGTGLGLATCERIVKQHKGHIEVSSRVGEGTTFRIYLPRVQQTAETFSRETISEAGLEGKETILIAEDEDAIRNFVARVLREKGYTVIEASNAKEALKHVQENSGKQFDLLFTDIVMPGMNGDELIQRLNELRPGIKVLFSSGYVDHPFAKIGSEKQGFIFLEKPFSANILLKKIRSALEKN